MNRVCAWCGSNLDPAANREPMDSPITHGICADCAYKILGFKRHALNELLETLSGPVVVVDADGAVLEANTRARGLLNKTPEQMQGKRTGDIIECEYARSPGGCGSTDHCQTGCIIRRSVTHTLSTGEAVEGQMAIQSIFTPSEVRDTRFLISTEKVEELVLLRFDEIDGPDSSS